MQLCQGLIFIWIALHHVRTIPAASLRSEYLDTSFHDKIKSHPDQNLHNSFVEQSNYYQQSDDAKFRPMLPYERRNRPIFTSKTYFGKNQMKELPRKYWENKGDEMISPLRGKAGRHLNPLKYAPLRSPHVEFNHQKRKIPKIHFKHQVELPDQNAGHVYDANPGYASKDEYDPNPRHVSRNEYGVNPGYASRDEYGANPGYASRDEYGANPGYASRDEFGTNQRHASRDEYRRKPIEVYGHVHPEHANKEEYGRLKPENAVKDEYDSKQKHATSDERKDLGFDTKAGYLPNQRYEENTGYDIQPGYIPNLYESNLGYDGNAERFNLEEDFKKKFMEYRIEELRKEVHTVEKINEDRVEEKDVDNDDRTIFINESNQSLLPDKDSDFFSIGNDAETSAIFASNSDFNTDENLKKDELLRHSDEDKFRKLVPDITSDESDDTKELVEQFEGSGEMENPLDTFNILDREANKSARILDIFSGLNDSSQCTTPKNESGHCRGLTECPLIETMENFSSFLQYMCFQRGRIVGICCPDNPVIEVKESVEDKSQEKVKLDIQQPPDGCGLSTNTRIVGGTMSVPHEFSWMVALLRRNRFYCGGVIINDWYILTAAHCVLGIKISDLKVRLGEFDFLERNDIQQDIPVTEIKRHALFVTSTFQHDIALLKMKRKIEYTKFIGSICLPDKVQDFSKKNATVAGWGTVSFGGAASPILRQVTVPVWDNKECDRTYVFERINESFMCAGASVSGEDACQGDSGGPLMSMNDEGRWEVIGIVSWGRRCGDPSYPGVYTRVTSYLDWIAENAQ